MELLPRRFNYLVMRWKIPRAKKLRDWIEPENIWWNMASINSSALELLEKNPDEINWYWLAYNTAAIHLLEKNPDKIHWYMLSLNSSIFISQ